MKGICFIEPLLRLVVLGLKTQTRRIIKFSCEYNHTEYPLHAYAYADGTFGLVDNGRILELVKPRYKAGETLYLKEPYYYETEAYGFTIPEPIVHYKLFAEWKKFPWKNKLFMPEKYARNFITMNDVRVERMQEISDGDCLKEGIMEIDQKGVFFSSAVMHTGARAGICKVFDTPQAAYAALINKINGKGTWESNPYSWVYDFKFNENGKSD
jgi:hypothetical protein